MLYYRRMGLELSSSDAFLYVHVPFCAKRCLYCDFTSTTDASLIESYFESLLEDLKGFSNLLVQKNIRTVYFGGGTPTFVNPSHLRRVLGAVEVFLDPFEITIEANPESFTKEKAIEYRDMGVSRVSVGVQAFDDDVLRMSGRPHGTKEIFKALELALNFFDRVNVDFIVGLPGYDFSVVEKNISLIERFRPHHVSVYTLELHEETPLHRLVSSGKAKLPENTMEMFHSMRKELEGMGYERYEISNFAREGAYSVHNLSYWYNLDYIGVGASAGGHIGRYRYVRTLSVQEYIRNPSANS